ncbi:putative hypoxanthine oxidase [Morganella morganii]|nr:putative hypoxanthine oxidase [Morganella morganii]
MNVHFILNGTPHSPDCIPGETSVTFCSAWVCTLCVTVMTAMASQALTPFCSTAVLSTPHWLIAAQLEGAVIETAESLGKWNELSDVQQAMVDVGVIQSGYNDPAAALDPD